MPACLRSFRCPSLAPSLALAVALSGAGCGADDATSDGALSSDAGEGGAAGGGTSAVPDTALPPPFSPAARVVSLALPNSVDTAREMGCDVVGAKGGSGLAPVGRLLGEGGLDEVVTRAPDGSIGLVLLFQAAGFEAAPGALALRAFYGDAVPGSASFTVDPTSVGDDGQSARIAWPEAAVSALGDFETEAVPFTLTLPLGLDLPPVDLVLEHAAVRGRAALDTIGFSLSETFLEGYLTRDSLLALIDDFKTACSRTPPPEFCNALRAYLNPTAPPETTLNILLALVGGYDVGVAAAGPVECSPAARDCNAIGVCLKLSAEGVTIDGVTPAPPGGP
jgi:hypothetical protein